MYTKKKMIEIKVSGYWTLLDVSDVLVVNVELLEAQQFKISMVFKSKAVLTIEQKFTKEQVEDIVEDVMEAKNPRHIEVPRADLSTIEDTRLSKPWYRQLW